MLTLLLASVYVHVTTVAPCAVIGNVVVVVPVIVPAQLSVAVGAVGAATLHSAVRSESVVTFATGAVVSTTVIVCVYAVSYTHLTLPTICSV